MFKILKKLVRPRLALLGGVALLLWQGWVWYNGESTQRPAMDDLRSETADEFCMQFAYDLPHEMDGQAVLVCDIVDDDSDYVKWALNESLKKTGRFKVAQPGLIRRIGKELKIPTGQPETKEDNVTQGKAAGADYVIYGKVEEFSYSDKAAKLRCELEVVDVANAAVVVGMNDEYVKRELDFSRLPLWAAFVILWPLGCLWLIRRIVRSESNLKIAAGLFCFVVVDWVLLGWCIEWNFSLAAVGLQVLLMLLAAGYDYWIFLKAENSRVNSRIF